MLTLIIYTSINSDLSFCFIISHGFHLYQKNPDRHGATAFKNHPKRMRRKVSGSRQAQYRRFYRLTRLPNSAFLHRANATFRKTFKFSGNKSFHARPASSLPCFLFFAVLNTHHCTRQPPKMISIFLQFPCLSSLFTQIVEKASPAAGTVGTVPAYRGHKFHLFTA